MRFEGRFVWNRSQKELSLYSVKRDGQSTLTYQFIDMQIGTAVFNVKTIEATEIDNGFFGKPSSASAERSIRITTECGGTISLKLLSDKPEKLQILDMELVPKHPEEIGSKETAA